MDLASPSPPPEFASPSPEIASPPVQFDPVVSNISEQPSEPTIIGAWPKSRSVSPIRFAPILLEGEEGQHIESAPPQDPTNGEQGSSSIELPSSVATNETGDPSPTDEDAHAINEPEQVDTTVSELQSGLTKLQVFTFTLWVIVSNISSRPR